MRRNNIEIFDGPMRIIKNLIQFSLKSKKCQLEIKLFIDLKANCVSLI